VRYVELFAGAGGLSLGLDAAGMECVAHAEIEPHAQAVLRKHWPDTPLHGDVMAVDWTQYAGRVELVSGGSPCQDLSVAGKRAGLDGARSGLFFELIRAWDETGAPYCLWENVDGARSSNAGADFAAVLSAFVGAAVAVPERWASSGVAAGATGVAAWRVLDLQHFGPPQRRRRVFVLAARTGGVDPAEVLAVSEGLCGHPAPRSRSRQGPARGAAGGVGSSYGIKGSVIGRSDDAGSQRSMAKEEMMFCLQTHEQHAVVSVQPAVLAFGINNDSRAECVEEGVAGLRAGQRQQHAVLAFHSKQTPISGAVSPSLGVTTDGMGVVQTLALDQERNAHTEMMGTLNIGSKSGGGQHPVVCTTGPITHALTAEGCDASEDGTGRGTPIVANTICAREAKGWNPARDVGNGAVQIGRPRRLTPLECERLMSWPDHWTAQGVREDWTEYALSDTARYRLCGNGVGSVVAAWIARRLVWAETHTPTAAPSRPETR